MQTAMPIRNLARAYAHIRADQSGIETSQEKSMTLNWTTDQETMHMDNWCAKSKVEENAHYVIELDFDEETGAPIHNLIFIKIKSYGPYASLLMVTIGDADACKRTAEEHEGMMFEELARKADEAMGPGFADACAREAEFHNSNHRFDVGDDPMGDWHGRNL